ncbi:hypothetical protein [Roseibium sp. Sym1]|uniref:hypothetical protein n=1 Tax=Roseibium sp. Sym1 TaxID=3016006 RepID=UPI0022B4D919|nr:hypothetical protein [Roseibium sp. Sym1]
MDEMQDGQSAEGSGTGLETQTLLAGVSEDNLAFAAENGWESANSVIDGYRGLQEQLAQSVLVPGETASPEEMEAFYGELATRWTPQDGYRFKMPDTLPDAFPYDQAFAEEVSGWFQEAGLPPSAAQKLHDRWLGKMSDHYTEQQAAAGKASAARDEAVERAHKALVGEYGEPGSDGYENLVARADRALTGLKSAGVDLTDWFVGRGALTQADGDGLQQVSDPRAVKLLAFIHDRAFAEDSLDGIASMDTDANPFETGNPDLKRQSDLLERNPAQARRLILSAGRDPGLFRL